MRDEFKKIFRHFLLCRAYRLSPKEFIQQLEYWLITPNTIIEKNEDDDNETVTIKVGFKNFSIQEIEQISRILILFAKYDYLLIITSVLQWPVDPHSQQLLSLPTLQKLYEEIKQTKHLFSMIDFSTWPLPMNQLEGKQCLSTLTASATDRLNYIEAGTILNIQNLTAAHLFANNQQRLAWITATTDAKISRLSEIIFTSDDSIRALLMNSSFFENSDNQYFFEYALTAHLIRVLPNDFVNTQLLKNWSMRDMNYYFQHGWQPGCLFAYLIQHHVQKARELFENLPIKTQADLFIFAYYCYGISTASFFPSLMNRPPLRQHLLPEQEQELLAIYNLKKSQNTITQILLFKEIFQYLPDRYRRQSNVNVRLPHAMVISRELEQLQLVHHRQFNQLIKNLIRPYWMMFHYSVAIVVGGSMSFMCSSMIYFMYAASSALNLPNDDVNRDMYVFFSSIGLLFVSMMAMAGFMVYFEPRKIVSTNRLHSQATFDGASQLAETIKTLELVLNHLHTLPEMKIRSDVLNEQRDFLTREKNLIDMLTPHPPQTIPSEEDVSKVLRFQPFYYKPWNIAPSFWQSSRLSKLRKLLESLEEYSLETLHNNDDTQQALKKYWVPKENDRADLAARMV